MLFCIFLNRKLKFQETAWIRATLKFELFAKKSSDGLAQLCKILLPRKRNRIFTKNIVSSPSWYF
jgi:hypothetical protein